MAHPLYKKFQPTEGTEETLKRFMAWAHHFFGNPKNVRHYMLWRKTAQIHVEMARAFASRLPFVLVTAPRGFAKTTWCRLWVIYAACYKMEPMIAFVSKPKQGAVNGRIIRNKLATNTDLTNVYGLLLPETNKARRDQEKRKDNDDMLTLVNGVTIAFTTIESGMHGMSHDFRPTLIVCEDLQAMKHMHEPSTLAKHLDIFENDVVFARDNIFGKVVVIGNNYGKGSIVTSIIEETKADIEAGETPKWHTVIMDTILDEKGRSRWEGKYTTAKAKSEEARYRRQGKGRIWDLQMNNRPDDSLNKRIEGYLFHECSLARIGHKNYLISDKYPHPLHCNVIAAIDPAFGEALSTDERARVLMAKAMFPINATTYVPGIFILKYWYDHCDPSDIPGWIVEQHENLYLDDMVIEANGGQRIMQWLCNKEFKDNPVYKRNPFRPHYITYVSESKGDRIWNCIGLMCKYGQFFVRREHVELIDELDNFGYKIRRKQIHLLDAAQMGDAHVIAPEIETRVRQEFIIPERFRDDYTEKRDRIRRALRQRGLSFLTY
jgi:hypothetical protein